MRIIRTVGQVITASLLGMPVFALAQTATAQQGVMGTLGMFSQIFNMLIGILVTLAVVVFFWGLVRYLSDVGDQKSKGLHTMVWGIIAIFVMVSIWGIINLLQNTFGVGGYKPPPIPPPPTIPGYNVSAGNTQP